MLRWTPYVMVRVALFFSAGILLGIYQSETIPNLIVRWCIILLILAYLVSFILLSNRKHIRILSGVIGLLTILLFGYLRLQNNIDSFQENHLIHVNEPITYYEVIVRGAPESKARSWKLEVEVSAIQSSSWREASGKVLLYLSKRTFPEINWAYGERILIKGSPELLRPPANPHEFDYKRFLGFKNIYHQHFVNSSDVIQIAGPVRKGFLYYSIKSRQWASSIINRYVKGEQEQAIAMALVLGVTDGIDTDLQNAYAASGAMHVLAVSGLHVGIIYGILLFLLKPLNKFSWSRWIIFIVSIFCLWLFAFITGLSPSVLRAVTMFSFVALARPLGWKTNIYNTLAGSAFLLLLFNPYLIMSVGFQLSYLAVLGIVYLQRPIYNLLEIENKYLDWVWQITCVSIAAQASTFALGMLYFHQFPVYFLISNLFVIPLSTVILIGGIFLLVFNQFTWIGSLLGFGLGYLIQLLNWIVLRVERWPYSLIEEIHLTTFQCWLIMIILLGFIFLIEFKSFSWIYLSLIATVFLIVTQWRNFTVSNQQNQFVVYSINGHHAMEWLENDKSYFQADSLLLNDSDRIRFHIRPNRLNNGIKTINYDIPFKVDLTESIKLFRWRNYTFMHYENHNQMKPGMLPVDYVIVSRNSLNLESLKRKGFNAIILDGTNSRAYINRCMLIAQSNSIKVHSVLDHGAFIIND